MAARVNTRFVAILAVVLVGLMGVTAFIAYQALQKSADDLIQAGDQAAQAGEWDKAVGFYAKAVNKDQRNAVWIERWLAAMQKITPKTRAAYQDQYAGQYLTALRAAIEADRTNVKVFERFLEERLKLTRLSGNALSNWEAFDRLVTESLKDFQGKDEDRKRLRRYQGIAKAGIVQTKADIKEDAVKAALTELEAALSADPKDWLCAVLASDMELTLAELARKRDDDQARTQMQAASKSRLEAFIRDHAPAPVPRFRLLVQEVADAARAYRESPQADKSPFPGPALLRERAPAVKTIVQELRALPADRVDPDATVNIAVLVLDAFTGLEPADPAWDAGKVSAELMELARKARPEDAASIDFAEASVLAARGKFEDADAIFNRIVAAPDLPLSLAGYRLIVDLRARALQASGEMLFTRWRQATTAEERTALQKRYEEVRADLASRIGETDPSMLAMDARGLMMRGDLAAARTAATRFNDLDNRQSLQMIMFEADLSARTGNTGRARQLYTEVLTQAPTNLEAILRLADIEANQGNIPEVTRLLQMATTIDPNNTQIREIRDRAKELQTGGNDPVLKALREAQLKAEGIEGDIPGALQIIRTALDQRPADPVLSLAAAQLLLRQGDRAEARRLITESMAIHTNDQRLIAASRSLEGDNNLEAQLGAIDNAPVTDLQKALARYEVYAKADQMDKARAELAKAKAIAPEDPLVVEALFQDAVRTANAEELDRLVKIAEQRNIDQLDGRLFQARRQIALKRYEDAAATLREALNKDRFNVLALRLLGLLLIDQRDFPAAADILKRAYEINPNDPPTNKAFIRALVLAGRTAEGLTVARDNEKRLGGDKEFAELLLQLESEAPGGNRQRAIEIRKTLAERNPDDITNKGQLAALLINESRFDEARPLIESLRTARPDDPAVLELDAGLKAASGDIPGAQKTFEEFIERQPEDKRSPRVFINAAAMLTRFGQIDAARALLDSGRKYQDPKQMEIDRQIGDLLFNLEKYPECLEAYARVLAAGGADQSNVVVKRVIEAEIRSGKAKEAQARIAAMGKAVEQDATLMLLDAEAALELKDKARARQIYDDAIRLFPKNEIVFLKRADLNRPDPAMARDVEADYEQVLRLNPAQIVARVRLANLYREQGRVDAAAEQFKRALDQAPGDFELRATYIDLQFQRGKIDEAAAAIDEIVRAQPDNPAVLSRAAMLMARINRFDKAADYLAPVWAKQRSPEVASMYATSLLAKEPPDLQTANVVLVAPESQVDKNVGLRMLRAKWHRLQRRMKEATDEVLATYAMVNHNRRDQVVQFLSGMEGVYGKPEERLAALDRLEQIKPFSEWMSLQTALLRSRAGGDTARIASTLTAVVEKAADPTLKASIYDMLGGMSYAAQRWEEALNYFKSGLEVDPENPALNNNAAFVLSAKLNRPDDAMPFARRAVKGNPNNSSFFDTLGTIFLAKGDLTQAAEYLAKAISIASSDAERGPVFMHLARVRLEQGDRAEARRLIQQAGEIFRANPELAKPYEEDLKQLRRRIDGVG